MGSLVQGHNVIDAFIDISEVEFDEGQTCRSTSEAVQIGVGLLDIGAERAGDLGEEIGLGGEVA
jgi:hypothetical protein